MNLLRSIRHTIARYRFQKAFGHFDKQAEECRRKHKRGVLEATAAKRKAVNMALAGKTLVKL